MRAFVLSGGSGRGAMQVGALEVLFDRDIKPEMLVGSSVGAINAAYLASNPSMDALERLREIYGDTDFTDIFGGGETEILSSIVNGDRSLFNHDSLRSLVKSGLEERTFGELELPCYVVTTDIDDGSTRVFGDDDDDPLLAAIVASASMIPLHPPVSMNDHEYADGGLASILPISEAVERGATEIYALNIASQLRPRDERTTMLGMIMHTLDLLLQGQMNDAIERAREKDDVDLTVINLEAEEYRGFTDLSNLEKLVDRGKELTEEALSS